MTEKEWYRINNCSHAHCPYECEHPQPFIKDGKMICGKCYFVYGHISYVIPCNPKTCKD